MGFVDYYDVLQVSPRADAEVIEKAYRALISKHHPDKGGDLRHAQLLNEAHDVIGDPQKRAAYDREWVAHQRRTEPRPRGATSASAPAPAASTRPGRPRQGLPAVWILGLLLVVAGLIMLAAGSLFWGVLLAAAGAWLLGGLWLPVMLLAIAVGLLARLALGARRTAG